MTKINEEEIKKLREFLHLQETMVMLINSANYEKEKIIDVLESHRTFVKGILIDFGIKFNEVEKIRSLNTRLRELEENFSNPNFNNQTVSAFISSEYSKFKKYLNDIGFRFSMDYSYSPDISISINLFTVSKKEDKIDDFNKFINTFETGEQYEGSFRILYNKKNLDKIKEIVNNYFKTFCSIEYEIVSGKNDSAQFLNFISKFHIYIPVTPFAINLHEHFGRN